jgi:putative hydrolase of the HAD superfamily
MKCQAVIFDLFGTLVPNFTDKEYRQVCEQMAEILGAPPEEFWRLWRGSFNERVLGILPDVEANIKYVCRQLSINPTDDRIQESVKLRFYYEARALVARPETSRVLASLKARGLKLGLISDCSSEAPAVWKDIPISEFFEVALFSCQLGIKKPDIRIYHLAAEKLGVAPGACLYVGDGSSQELTGAVNAGMTAVHLKIPSEIGPDAHRIDLDDWSGAAIESLLEVPGLVG